MSIIVVNNDSWYIKTARDILLASGNSIVSLSEEEFLGTFQPIMKEFGLISVEERQSLTILVDVESVDAIELMLKILRRNTSVVQYIRIVLVSSLLTWCGKAYSSFKITDHDGEFLKRVPIASANDSYLLENSLYGFSKQHKISLSIIGVGLVYGGAGFDFKSIFNNIWTNEKTCKLLSAHSKSHLPFIHHETLVKLIVSTVENNNTTGVFIPAVEICEHTIQHLLTSINATINPSAAPTRANSPPRSPRSPRAAAASPTPQVAPADSAAPVEEYVKCEELGVRVEKLLYDARSSLWGCDLCFEVSHNSDNLLNDLPSVWKQFTDASNLKPLSILVTGNPKMGKTTTAKQVATELSVEYVDVMESVRFAFTYSQSLIQTLNATEWNTAVLSTVRSEIDATIEAKLNEGVKKGKDKNAPTEPQVFELSHVTDAVCAALSVELTRKCVAMKLLLDTKCIRYGFVLDTWGLSNDIFNGHTSLAEILSIIRVPYTGEDSKEHLEKLVNDKVELLVELQVPSDNIMVEKLVASQGANAKAKESQAAVKALEGVMAAYRAHMIPSSVAEGITTHKGIDELEKLCNGRLEVMRVNANEMPAEVITTKVVDRMFDKHCGQIGWLPSRPFTAPVPHVEVVASEAVEVTPEAVDAGGAGNVVEEVTTVTQLQTATTESAPAAVFDSMSREKLESIAKKSEKSQSFLSNTLLPHIATAMVIIRRERPQDPIQFLANYLLEQSQILEDEAREKAKNEFYATLSKESFAPVM